MSERLAVALRLCAAGLPVLPLYGPAEGTDAQKGKRPRQTGWEKRANTAAELAAWFDRHPASNVGLVTGALSRLVCVDLDLRKGGGVWREANRERIRALGKGVGVEKTGNGWHLWFRHPGGIIRSGTDRVAPGVDLLADGGHQAVIAPSIHRDGAIYTWLSGFDLADLPEFGVELPGWIATAEAGAPVAAPSRVDREVYTDTAANVERCRARLQDVPGAVEGAGGDNATIACACIGRDYGLSPAAFWPLFLDWNETCSPPWEAEALMEKLHNGYRYAKASAPGQATPEADFRAVDVLIGEGGKIVPPAPALAPEAAEAQAAELVGPNGWHDSLIRAKGGDWKSHTRNVELVLTHDARLAECFRYNLMAQRVEVVSAPWRKWKGASEWIDDDEVALGNWIANAYPARPTLGPEVVRNAVRPYARQFSYHPVRDYLDGLTWDGKPRIGTWLCRFAGAVDDVYTRAVARRFLIAAVARVRKPGCKVDAMLILEGEQGQLKSTAAKVLFGEEWFTDAELEIGNKDAAATIRGRWCVEIPELTAAGKAEVNLLKAFISRQVDRQRDSYGRNPEDHPRHCVFVGTTNSAKYLRDATGGRRFWPIRTVGRLHIDALKAQRDQLWAEASAAFDAGEQHWLTDVEEAAARGEQEERYMADEWEAMVAAWLAKGGDFGEPGKSCKSIDRITSMEVWTGCLNGSAATLRRDVQHRIAEVMERIGWQRGVYRVDGRNVKGYLARGASVASVEKPDIGSI